LLLLGGAAGCKKLYPLEPGVTSFKVTIKTPKEALGTAEKPLPFVAGMLCGVDGAPACDAGETCIRYCSESGAACEQDGDCTGQYEACTGACTVAVTVSIEAIGTDGLRYEFPRDDEATDHKAWLKLEAVPGFVPPSVQWLTLEDGYAADVTVHLARGLGETYVWVEDAGVQPKAGTFGQCNDGKDNDGNGVTDLADPGCLDVNDDVEGQVSGAAGVSDLPLVFENPRLRHLQWSPTVSSSPLQGQDVRVTRGQMVVTNVTSTGLYVTDLADQAPTTQDGQPGYYNSMFLYTWTTPTNVSYGDALCWLSGGVVEHEGNTQITFPTYWAYWGDVDDPECQGNPDFQAELKVPDPVPVNDLLIVEDPASTDFAGMVNDNSIALEPLEDGLVKAEDLAVSSRFIACDANGNGDIDVGSDEDSCRNVCQLDPLCTQLESYFKYNQYAVYVGGKKKLYLSGEMLVKYSPLRIEYLGQQDLNGKCQGKQVWVGTTRFLEYNCPESKLTSASGNLRHIFLCPAGYTESRCSLQLHTIVPRFDEDIVEVKE
jgi:hypothetical protein